MITKKQTLEILTTDTAKIVLQRMSEEIFRTQITRNKLNPSEF